MFSSPASSLLSLSIIICSMSWSNAYLKLSERKSSELSISFILLKFLGICSELCIVAAESETGAFEWCAMIIQCESCTRCITFPLASISFWFRANCLYHSNNYFSDDPCSTSSGLNTKTIPSASCAMAGHPAWLLFALPLTSHNCISTFFTLESLPANTMRRYVFFLFLPPNSLFASS